MPTESEPSTMVKVFISYSHNDKKWCDEIKKHLKPSSDKINVWVDHELKPGEEWDREIAENLKESDIILYLVSIEFLTSEYIKKELATGYELREDGSAKIIPILVSHCNWQNTYLAGLQALPIQASDGRLRPLEEWEDRDKNRAYVSIVSEIEKKASKIVEARLAKEKETRLQKFRKKCQECLRTSEDSVLSIAAKHTLEDLRDELGISQAEAEKALGDEAGLCQTRKRKCNRYLDAIKEYIRNGIDLSVEKTKKELKQRQLDLNLEDDDINSLHPEIDRLVREHSNKKPRNSNHTQPQPDPVETGKSSGGQDHSGKETTSSGAAATSQSHQPDPPRLGTRWESIAQRLREGGTWITGRISPMAVIEAIHRKKLFPILALPLLGYKVFFVPPFSQEIHFCNNPLKDNISEGEQIFTLYPSDSKVDKNDHGLSAKKCEPSQVLSEYESKWKSKEMSKNRSELPEQLIYINNLMLESTPKHESSDYYTIAVAISIPETNDANEKTRKINFNKEILRGIAQLQTKINLGFFASKSDSRLEDLVTYHHSPPKLPVKFKFEAGIKGRGLKVLIVNDAEHEETAEKVAKVLSGRRDIVGLIGHYASKISIKTVETYKNSNLAMVSPGSTTPDLTDNPKRNFFRTVYTGTEQAKEIGNFFINKKIFKASSFYSDDDEHFSVPFNKQFEIAYRERGGKIINIKKQELDKKEGFLSTFNSDNLNSIIKELNKISSSQSSDTKLRQNEQFGVLLIPSPVGETAIQNASELMQRIQANKIVGTWRLRQKTTADALRSLSNDDLDKIVFAVPWDRLDKLDESEHFVKEADFLWGKSILQPVTATTYDATKVLVHALEILKTEKQLFRDERENIIKILSKEGFKVDGVTGPIKFIEGKGDRMKFEDVSPVRFVRLFKCKPEETPNFFPIGIDPVQYCKP